MPFALFHRHRSDRHPDPACGVLYWQWDTFQLLVLYWMETVIIAFWTIRRIARLRPRSSG